MRANTSTPGRRSRFAGAVVCLALLLLSGCAAPAGNSSASVSASEPPPPVEVKPQPMPSAAFEILYTSFLTPGDPEPDFPDNYGGAHIQDGLLHICIVDLPSQDMASYTTLLQGYENVIVFDAVAYSMNTLRDASDAIADDLINDGIFVVDYGVDEAANSVTLSVLSEYADQLGLSDAAWEEKIYSAPLSEEYGVPVTVSLSAPVVPY